MPILVELPRICLSSLVNVCFPKCVDSHMHVRFARPSFASDIDNLSVTAVRFVTGTEWNHVRRVRRHVRRVRCLSSVLSPGGGGGSFTIDLFRLPLGFTVVEQLYSEVPNMRYSGFL